MSSTGTRPKFTGGLPPRVELQSTRATRLRLLAQLRVALRQCERQGLVVTGLKDGGGLLRAAWVEELAALRAAIAALESAPPLPPTPAALRG
ncbi:hypothetical protein [Synechococcus sp. CBW1107]|uniref:hypothetical protein n=1 Tax=Synechococcus sp. CBW1107 TaxID=2789857 RepID=UPI002AD4D8A1|nr:hypothetical protein [Synechococcus sp. CBW1107]CAK6701034.1 hypothetical protein IFHNHDMJ_02987 [Synechococcus sp. CBW1107]